MANFEAAVGDAEPSNYWEYHRLLSLCGILDPGLLRRFLSLGMENLDPDIRESAEDFEIGSSGDAPADKPL